MRIPSRSLVIGVGNEFRGDDAVGRFVARKLKESLGDEHPIAEEAGDPEALMQAWKDADLVIVVDAIRSGCRPGTIRRIDARAQEIPKGSFDCSTHTFGIAEAIALARALDCLPAELIVYGIEGRSFTPGTGLSPEVEAGANEVIRRLSEELSTDLPHEGSNAAAEALARPDSPHASDHLRGG